MVRMGLATRVVGTLGKKEIGALASGALEGIQIVNNN